jgi:hypothetical protein
MKQGEKMKYHKRFLRLEKLAKEEDRIPAVAIRFLNGTIAWDDRVFPNEDEFNRAVERALRNEPPAPGPQVVVITFWRKMKEYSLDKLRGKQVFGNKVNEGEKE